MRGWGGGIPKLRTKAGWFYGRVIAISLAAKDSLKTAREGTEERKSGE